MAKNSNENEVTTPIAPLFYNYRNRPPKVQMCSKNPTKTQESPLDAKSPQELMDKHGMYIDRPSLKDLKPFYADLTQFQSYEDSLNSVRTIKEKFMNLDVSIRAKFNHNPEEFCNYVQSKDFDIREIMTSDMYKEYQDELDLQEQERLVNEYKMTDDYKKMVVENKLRDQFLQEQFENWKKQFHTT